MASVQQRGKGSFLIQFYDAHGRKRGISVSKINKKIAQGIATRVDALNAAKRSNHPIDGATADWLNGIGDDLAAKLVGVGLIEPRAVAVLGPFLADHFKKKQTGSRAWKDRTKLRHETSKKYLLEFFSEKKPLREITKGDAEDFVLHLDKKKAIKADITLWKHVSNVKSYFQAAVDHQLIPTNPFAKIEIPRYVENKKHRVTREEANKVLDACPDCQWRMIFAFARYGGVRIPSEIEGLEWSHINWAENKIRILSPKTAHHPGKAERWIPLFPELEKHLSECYEMAAEGERYVITVARKGEKLSAAYISKVMRQIIQNAGLTPWNKLFNSCRSTRQTELEKSKKWSIFDVCKMLGNSPKVYGQFYDQGEENVFSEAATWSVDQEAETTAPQQQAIDAKVVAEKYRQLMELRTRLMVSGVIGSDQPRSIKASQETNDSQGAEEIAEDQDLSELRGILEGLEPPIDSL